MLRKLRSGVSPILNWTGIQIMTLATASSADEVLLESKLSSDTLGFQQVVHSLKGYVMET